MKKILLLAFAALLFASCADDNDDDNGIYYATSISIRSSVGDKVVDIKPNRIGYYNIIVEPSNSEYILEVINPEGKNVLTVDTEKKSFIANTKDEDGNFLTGKTFIVAKTIGALGYVTDTLFVNVE
ncbi:hypothetical protein M2132_001713 [Dysgonomonas sp. PH5-45]|uniref:hypothetical protein n=1 Tax=unclassified Dysgonomonas TaxID=2630389 RepID=UPI0024738A90|nr:MULTISPECIES: hypothetical protein [unclassified Dysgonomonas]MDH6355372.1 hypothetical protein [Dysgonomonas sp. PH5-45]MDH6388270.1 hypothetical protein [Dysgonomonas sp. PH5-37]